MIRNFFKDQSGNVALTATLSLFVLAGAAGGAFDYSRVHNAKSHFQNVTDSAALAAALEYRKTDWNKAETVGENHISTYTTSGSGYVITTSELTLDGQEVVATVKGYSQNYVLSATGLEKFDFSVSSRVKLPDYPIEVALVLDTTFSMSVGNKMNTLKSTAKDFVDTLLNIDSDQVRISMVPFANYVNVNPNSLGASWLEAANEDVVVPRQCTTVRPEISRSGCTSQTVNVPARDVPESCSPAQYNDGVMVSPASCTPAYREPATTQTTETCTNIQYGDPVETCTPEQRYTKYWNGCVASREDPFNTNDNNYSRKVPGPIDLVCPSPITPLTDNRNALRSAIDALTPVGNTYIPQGVVWGYRTLTKQAPYDQALSDATRDAKNGRRFIVLMTDGQNSRSPEYSTDVLQSRPGMRVGLHSGNDIDVSNDYLIDTCTNAKAEEIEIYTVSFGAGVDTATKALLKQCATEDDMYYDASTNNDLIATFQSIADSIVTVYLSD